MKIMVKEMPAGFALNRHFVRSCYDLQARFSDRSCAFPKIITSLFCLISDTTPIETTYDIQINCVPPRAETAHPMSC